MHFTILSVILLWRSHATDNFSTIPTVCAFASPFHVAPFETSGCNFQVGQFEATGYEFEFVSPCELEVTRFYCHIAPHDAFCRANKVGHLSENSHFLDPTADTHVPFLHRLLYA